MHNRFYRNIIIRTYESAFKHRRTFRYWSELERSQWQTPAELRERQLAALCHLLRHAADECSYYRDSWRQLNLQPEQVAAFDDFRRWPILDRDNLRTNCASMLAISYRGALLSKTTGGSSGDPLQFYMDQNSNDRRMAAWHRGYAWAGAEPGTRQVYLWGAPLGNGNWQTRWKDHLYWRWIYRRELLNTFDLNDQTIPKYLHRYNRFRPKVLVAYTNPLYAFARWLEERKIVPFSPHSIVVGAEKLHDFQRTLIEKVFCAPVFETYGCREFMLIGAECDRHEGLHLTMEHLLVEIVDENGQPTANGEEGQVVITDLYNYGMPFIRCLTGDRAVAGFSTCSCGRGLPLLRKVVGRQLDILTTPSGRKIPGELFPYVMKDIVPVRRYQAIQCRPDEIVLKLVLDKTTWSAIWRERVIDGIQSQLDDTIKLTIQEVDEIPLTVAGKLQVVVNQCNRDKAVGIAHEN